MMPAAPYRLNVVVPMAGLGSRFQRAGWRAPKPLIDIHGRPMYAWATESLPLRLSSRLIFVLLGESEDYQAIRADIDRRYADARTVVLTVPTLTAGQAVTVARARDLIETDDPLIIHNADTAFDADPEWAERVMQQGLDGALLVFRSDQPRWSFARVDASDRVVEVREKQCISAWASTGTYWFRRGKDFIAALDEAMATGRPDANEYYVGPLYNRLIANGARIGIVPIRQLYCFGTPEDLDSSLRTLSAARQPDTA